MICPSGKLQMRTRKEAVILNKATGERTGEYFNIYRCLLCNDFHFASRTTNKKVKRFNRL